MEAQIRKQVLRAFSYGVYILGLKRGDGFNASTVSWVSQVSFEPPLVMVALRNESLTREMVEASRCFTINVVGEDQAAIAGAFFKPARLEDNRLNGYAFQAGAETGAPVFTDVPAWLECKVVEMVTCGDHTMAIAEVVDAGVRDGQVKPLPLSATTWHYGG